MKKGIKWLEQIELSVVIIVQIYTLVPLMYPLSLTACRVGRRVRNFFSLCLVFLLSEPSMLVEVFMAAVERLDRTLFELIARFNTLIDMTAAPCF